MTYEHFFSDTALAFGAVATLFAFAVFCFVFYAVSFNWSGFFTALVVTSAVGLVAMYAGGVEDSKRGAAEHEMTDAISRLESTYGGINIKRYPENTSRPGEWKVDDQFLTCYAEGLPDPQATDEERDAQPLLVCKADTAGDFQPFDEIKPVDSTYLSQPQESK